MMTCPAGLSKNAGPPKSCIVNRRGRSVGEVVFVLLLLAVIMALIVPWMQRSRERARQVRCQSNLQMIATGLQSYQATFAHFPVGTLDQSGKVCSEPTGFHHNWLSGLLGPMGLQSVEEVIDRKASVYASANEAARELVIPEWHCPSSLHVPENMTDYAGCTGSIAGTITEDHNGVFIVNRHIRASDVTDGLDYTLFVGEKLPLPEDLGWLSGTRSSLRGGTHQIGTTVSAEKASLDAESCFVGGFGSMHVGGAYLMMGSGRYTFFSDRTDLQTLLQLAGRSDEPVSDQP